MARRSAGFTLIELLVALMVMALLGLMSWRGLDGMSAALQRTRARSDAVQIVQTGLAQWRVDLDAMVPGLPTTIDWNGKVLRITRTGPQGGAASLQVVAWSVQSAASGPWWSRWQSPPVRTQTDLQQAWLQAAVWGRDAQVAAGGPSGVVDILPAFDMTLYYFRGGSWTNPLSSTDNGNLQPDGVRLVLELAPGQPLTGRLTRDWVRGTMANNKL